MEVVGREGCISHGASKAYVALSPFLFPSFFTPAHVHSSRQIKKAYKCLCDWSFVNMPAANLNRQANVYFLVLIPFGEVGAADRCPKAHGVRRRAANAMEVSARAAPHISFSLLPILLNFRFTYLLSLVCLFPLLIVNSFFQCKSNTCVRAYVRMCVSFRHRFLCRVPRVSAIPLCQGVRVCVLGTRAVRVWSGRAVPYAHVCKALLKLQAMRIKIVSFSVLLIVLRRYIVRIVLVFGLQGSGFDFLSH